jgi:hypothetical protein
MPTFTARKPLQSVPGQVEAANQMGVPQSFIPKCESGERRFKVVELQGFAQIYEKSLTFFLQ